MATAAESTFYQTVAKAEAARQVAKAAAFVTYGFNPANLAAYLTALESADNTYIAAVNAAASTATPFGYTIANGPGGASANPGNVTPGGVGTDVISVNSSFGGAYGSATLGAQI